MIRAATRHIDDMHAVMADYGWRASVAQGSSDGGFSIDDFHTLQERVSMMRTDYKQLLTDRDYLLRVGEMYQSVTLTEDVDDLAKEHQSMGDTSICVLEVVDLHIEIDPAVRPGSVMQHEFAGDDMSILEHTVMSDSSQRDVEVYGGIQRGIVPCREETHSGEYVDVTPLQQHIVVGDHLHHFSSCVVDERWRLVDQQSEGLLLVVLHG
jgi:hypothetical protein